VPHMKLPSLRRVILGRPIPSHKAQHQRLPKFLALPVFASDALSSTAYGTQEIILMLTLAGAAGLHLTLPVSIAIVAVLVLVVLSYIQTVHAYPKGGGSYIVSKENISTGVGLLAASAILTDYILTVAVSTAAGIQQVTSFYPKLSPYAPELCVGAIMLITLANLRGAKESGALFAIPTYYFVLSIVAMVLVGLIGPMFGYRPLDLGQAAPHPEHALGWFLILKAFASGCAALTGVEAITDGVQAFKAPESKNAAITLTIMAVLLGSMFLGVSYLAQSNNIIYAHGMDGESLISLVARSVFHDNHYFRGAILLATTLILILAANTAFADFPRLSAILARDGFMPRQLANLGDKLVFSNGILLLGALSSLLVIAFKGHTDRLIPLYAVGVFLSFTLSQTGMVRRWLRLRPKGWRLNALQNGTGAAATGIVLAIIVMEKFTEGAWVVVVVIPIIMTIFWRIKAHYEWVGKRLSLDGYKTPAKKEHLVIILVSGIHRGILQAFDYAERISPKLRAVHVEINPDNTPRFKEMWHKWAPDIPLDVVESPYRSLVGPIVDYVKNLRREYPKHYITVLVPEMVQPGLAGFLLHNNAAFFIKMGLYNVRDVVITNLRFFLD